MLKKLTTVMAVFGLALAGTLGIANPGGLPAALAVPGVDDTANQTSPTTAPNSVTQANVIITRFTGANRFDTSVLVAQHYFPQAKTVFIATGKNFPDALAAGPATSKLAQAQGGAPILLVGDTLSATAQTYLRTAKPQQVIVVGGPATVPQAVTDQITQATGAQPTRVSGVDRFATAAAIADFWDPAADGGQSVANSEVGQGTPPNTVYLASGLDFPDALSGGALAAEQKMPLLLVRPNELPATTAAALQKLRPQNIVALGGQAAVSDQVLTAAGTAVANAEAGTPAAQTSRIAGADRFATAAEVASRFASKTHGIAVVGHTYPDALVGGALAGHLHLPLLLAESWTLNSVNYPASVPAQAYSARGSYVTIGLPELPPPPPVPDPNVVPTKPTEADQQILARLDPRCGVGRVICVKKSDRRVYWIVNGHVRLQLEARFARPGYRTPEGTFSVIRKNAHWVSTLYGSRMPHSLFFHPGGYAIHFSYEFLAEGYSDGSHGCVNVRNWDAQQQLFNEVNVGERVIVAP